MLQSYIAMSRHWQNISVQKEPLQPKRLFNLYFKLLWTFLFSFDLTACGVLVHISNCNIRFHLQEKCSTMVVPSTSYGKYSMIERFKKSWIQMISNTFLVSSVEWSPQFRYPIIVLTMILTTLWMQLEEQELFPLEITAFLWIYVSSSYYLTVHCVINYFIFVHGKVASTLMLFILFPCWLNKSGRLFSILW